MYYHIDMGLGKFIVINFAFGNLAQCLPRNHTGNLIIFCAACVGSFTSVLSSQTYRPSHLKSFIYCVYMNSYEKFQPGIEIYFVCIIYIYFHLCCCSNVNYYNSSQSLTQTLIFKLIDLENLLFYCFLIFNIFKFILRSKFSESINFDLFDILNF